MGDRRKNRVTRHKKQRTWRIKRMQKLAETVEPLLPIAHAGPGRGNKLKPKDLAQSGNRSHYLMARIKRDHPDILQRCLDGEFASVKAAGIAAGIVKVKQKEKDNGCKGS